MARDMVSVMDRLGFDRFSVAGHDRGGRCGYRLALDHPDRVERLAVLDIVPTGEVWRRADMAFGMAYWHWFFLAQPHPVPERMIAADPVAFYFRDRVRAAELFAPEALAEYLRCLDDPDTVHAMCEDYRAGATFDREVDDADRGVRTIACPTLALWAARGALPALYDVLDVWGVWADDVRGREIDCGHYLPEEAPEETADELRTFFLGAARR